jgi:para-nitrobenzyl esterase
MSKVFKQRPFLQVRKWAASLTLAACSAFGAALCAGALLAAIPAHAFGAPIVQTQEGQVEGFQTKGITEFLGIPYAAPPVGNLRWRPPVAHAPWKKVLQATTFGPICAQTAELGVFAGPANSNEDCLYLNVFAPPVRFQKLPVLMFIHGGGSFDGEGSDYDGSKLALQGQMVVVTMNYRLNLFGFLAVPSLDNEGHLFANYGWLDQQMVLKWIQRNIAAFGGDKNNVTVTGESGGATSTSVQVVSPLVKGLFQHAICEEACGTTFDTLATGEARGTAFAAGAGCGSLTGAAQAACLRALPAAAVETLAGNGITYTTQRGAPGATGTGLTQDTAQSAFLNPGNEGYVDGTILPIQPLVAWQTGNFTHMPIINGGNRDTENFVLAELEFFEQPRVPLTAAQYEASVTAAQGVNAPAVLAHYPVSAYPSAQLAWDAEGTDPGSCGRIATDNLIAAQVPLYDYEFDDRTAPFDSPPLPGLVSLAYHTSELQYLFPGYHGGPLGIQHPLNRQQETLSDEMIAAWSNFAHTGNPDGYGNKPWPRYTTTAQNRLSFDSPLLSTLTQAQFSARHMCAFWNSL